MPRRKATSKPGTDAAAEVVLDPAAPCAWRLPPIVEIASIRPFCDHLRLLLAHPSPTITLDIEDVIAVDTAGLQALTCFVRTAQARGRTVAWENLSVILYQSACTLGLQDVMAL